MMVGSQPWVRNLPSDPYFLLWACLLDVNALDKLVYTHAL